MKTTALFGAFSVACAFALVACGGGSPSGSGGEAAGGSGGSTTIGSGGAAASASTGGAAASASSSASTGGAGGDLPEPGINCLVNGKPQSFPTAYATPVGPGNPDGVIFYGNAGPYPHLQVLAGEGLEKTGTDFCPGFSDVYYEEVVDGKYDDYVSFTSGASCTMTITHTPVAKGDRWIGTFSAHLLNYKGKPPIEVTEGTINVVY